MQERNKVTFETYQNNILYTISTSLIGNKINLVCRDSNSKVYENSYTLAELLKISQYFRSDYTIEQVQLYLNGIMEKQKIGISPGEEAVTLNLYLINRDLISIPLLRKTTNNINYINYNNNFSYAGYNNISQPNQYMNIINNQIPIQNPNIAVLQNNQKINPNLIPQAKNVNVNVKAMPQTQRYYNKNSGNINLSTNQQQNQYVQSNRADKSITLDENKLKTLEKENNIIKVGQEKLKNDIQRLIQEITKLKEENEVYKTDHKSLTNENAILKNETENCKKQMLLYQNQDKALMEENNMLKKQFEGYNKDLDNVENQNDEIRKMYEDLQNEYNQYRAQTEDMNKENEILRGQIEELNNNFTMINSELDNIRKENDIFKSNLEQQKKDLNEDMVNKLIEENNELRKTAEENEYLKKQIEELKLKIQNVNTNNNNNSNNNNSNEQEPPRPEEEEEEEKGEIIHDMKELELITDKINKGDSNQKIIINLLYKASVDGDKAAIFHEKCDQAKSTIVLVETLNGKRFGGFTTCSWAGNCEDKNDPQAFIFSLDKMETYDNIQGDEAIGCYPKFGPIFLGCQIKIFDNAFSKGGTTFEKELNFNTKENYELTGGDRVFKIKEIEVYEVVIE